MTALLLTLAALFITALAGLAKTTLTGEIRGLLSDHNHRAVDRAATLLPPDLVEELAEEWHAELAALESEGRLFSALRFVRALPAAARAVSSYEGLKRPRRSLRKALPRLDEPFFSAEFGDDWGGFPDLDEGQWEAILRNTDRAREASAAKPEGDRSARDRGFSARLRRRRR